LCRRDQFAFNGSLDQAVLDRLVIFTFDSSGIYDSDTILELGRLPKTLAVVGAGAVWPMCTTHCPEEFAAPKSTKEHTEKAWESFESKKRTLSLTC
jgi:hypothetical protein